MAAAGRGSGPCSRGPGVVCQRRAAPRGLPCAAAGTLRARSSEESALRNETRGGCSLENYLKLDCFRLL